MKFPSPKDPDYYDGFDTCRYIQDMEAQVTGRFAYAGRLRGADLAVFQIDDGVACLVTPLSRMKNRWIRDPMAERQFVEDPVEVFATLANVIPPGAKENPTAAQVALGLGLGAMAYYKLKKGTRSRETRMIGRSQLNPKKLLI